MKTLISLPFFCTVFFLTCSFAPLSAQGDEEVIIYVDASKNRNGGNNVFTEVHTYGKSWDTAFRYLHDALRFGDPNATQIWIAKGNYYLDRGVGVEDQTTSSPGSSSYLNPFVVSNRNLKIYGGFAGTETSLDERDPENNPTYLDGNVYYKDIHTFPNAGNLYDNDNRFARRIMIVYNSTLTLDGLNFQYVQAGNSAASSGSAQNTEPDSGLGAFIFTNQSAITIENCQFQYGVDGFYGQVIYSTNSTTELLHIKNSRFANGGNATNLFYTDAQEVIIEHCVFEELEKNRDGGDDALDLFNTSVDLKFKNNVFFNNKALRINTAGESKEDNNNSGTINIEIDNVLGFNNTLSAHDKGLVYVQSDSSSGQQNINLSITNSSFINNVGDGESIIYIYDDGLFCCDNFNVTMHNNVFYGNKVSENSEILYDVLTKKEEANKEIVDVLISGSHNATDKNDSKLITNSDYNDGAIDLSSASSLTDLFVGTTDTEGNFDAKGTDDEWFTEDDGFVPKGNGVLHNVGHNDAVADINADIKGHKRVQETTVDIGAYERGTAELTLEVEGLSSISELILYPNPIRSSQKGTSLLGYVTGSSSKPTRLVLRDLSGKLVRDLSIEDSGKGIDLGVLPSATYLAILSTEKEGYKSFKLVVE